MGGCGGGGGGGGGGVLIYPWIIESMIYISKLPYSINSDSQTKPNFVPNFPGFPLGSKVLIKQWNAYRDS